MTPFDQYGQFAAMRIPGGSNLPALPGAAGAVVGGMRMIKPGVAIARSLADRLGITTSKVWAMMKKLGPMSTAAFFGLTAEQALQMWAHRPRPRRMHVTNVSALRRSLRRLRGFDHLACSVKGQLGSYARAGGRSRRSCFPKKALSVIPDPGNSGS